MPSWLVACLTDDGIAPSSIPLFHIDDESAVGWPMIQVQHGRLALDRHHHDHSAPRRAKQLITHSSCGIGGFSESGLFSGIVHHYPLTATAEGGAILPAETTEYRDGIALTKDTDGDSTNSLPPDVEKRIHLLYPSFQTYDQYKSTYIGAANRWTTHPDELPMIHIPSIYFGNYEPPANEVYFAKNSQGSVFMLYRSDASGDCNQHGIVLPPGTPTDWIPLGRPQLRPSIFIKLGDPFDAAYSRVAPRDLPKQM